MRPSQDGSLVRSLVVILLLVGANSDLTAQTLASTGSSEKKDTASANGQLEPPPSCTRRSHCVALYADGSIRQTIEKKDGASPVAGSVGLSRDDGRSVVSLQINVAASADTVRSSYGGSILTPGTGGALSSGLIDFRLRPDSTRKRFGRFGAHFYMSVASTRWATEFSPPDSATGDSLVSATTDAAIMGVGAQLTIEILNGELSNTPIYAAIDFGVSARQLFGDIANSEAEAQALKQRLYGSTRETFAGLELGLVIQVNNIKAGLTYYFYDGDSRGLTDGQVVAGFGIQSNIFSGLLKKKPRQ